MMHDVNIEEETKCETSVLAMSLFLVHRRLVSSQSIVGYIMMHDVNIEEETKCETSVSALSLFSSSPMNLTGAFL